MTIQSVEKTRAYGRYRAVGVRADGGTVEGWGSTAAAAEKRARARAAEWARCQGCNRVTVPPAEAAVARRACRGQVLCAFCRQEAAGGPDPVTE